MLGGRAPDVLRNAALGTSLERRFAGQRLVREARVVTPAAFLDRHAALHPPLPVVADGAVQLIAAGFGKIRGDRCRLSWGDTAGFDLASGRMDLQRVLHLAAVDDLELVLAELHGDLRWAELELGRLEARRCAGVPSVAAAAHDGERRDDTERRDGTPRS